MFKLLEEIGMEAFATTNLSISAKNEGKLSDVGKKYMHCHKRF